jgi:hypothetical protein
MKQGCQHEPVADPDRVADITGAEYLTFVCKYCKNQICCKLDRERNMTGMAVLNPEPSALQ